MTASLTSQWIDHYFWLFVQFTCEHMLMNTSNGNCVSSYSTISIFKIRFRWKTSISHAFICPCVYEVPFGETRGHHIETAQTAKFMGPTLMMGPTWVLSVPDGPHVAPWTLLSGCSPIKCMANGAGLPVSNVRHHIFLMKPFWGSVSIRYHLLTHDLKNKRAATWTTWLNII